MLKIYGSMLCKDCVRCRQDLDRLGKAYVFFDINESLENMKAFLRIRDREPVFREVRREGKIGIPCLVDDEGKVSLSWE